MVHSPQFNQNHVPAGIGQFYQSRSHSREMYEKPPHKNQESSSRSPLRAKYLPKPVNDPHISSPPPEENKMVKIDNFVKNENKQF